MSHGSYESLSKDGRKEDFRMMTTKIMTCTHALNTFISFTMTDIPRHIDLVIALNT